QLYFTVADHVRYAFKEGIPSISHRSKQFELISKEATEGLKQLLGIGGDHYILFASSATEIWERLIQNVVAEKSFHFVNGSFSKKFLEIARQLNRQSEAVEVKEGEAFSESQKISEDTELIAVTHNETSTGVSLPLDFIHAFREKYPEKLIAVDAVSSLPYPAFDYTKIDSVYFSVQKAFGLPAGLGVWIINKKCVDKAEAILDAGKSIGSYHTIPSLVSMAKKHQTPETPNVLGIYLLAKVVADFNRRGIDIIRKETEYKAAILYQSLTKHQLLQPFVKDKYLQSKTVIVADCGAYTEKLSRFLSEKGMTPGDGYGSFKKSQLRFANFPAHSKEQYELLADSLDAFHG
ncbi:MAG TPA: aminotransferase class V-fold PLP-dependent enzyme, partial [Chryseosolibacter sp.]|nr:aminotransferase class V-fold PLP-dependent enzyme [Chryseosolibacter sp.]